MYVCTRHLFHFSTPPQYMDVSLKRTSHDVCIVLYCQVRVSPNNAVMELTKTSNLRPFLVDSNGYYFVCTDSRHTLDCGNTDFQRRRTYAEFSSRRMTRERDDTNSTSSSSFWHHHLIILTAFVVEREYCNNIDLLFTVAVSL
jgi:hypothetical protein